MRAFVVSSCRKSCFRVFFSLRYGADLNRSRLVTPKHAEIATSRRCRKRSITAQFLEDYKSRKQQTAHFMSGSFNCSKTNHVKDHVNADIHAKNVSLKKKKQTVLVPKKNNNGVDDSFPMKLADLWIGAGLPRTRLSDNNLKFFLEESFQRMIPCLTTLLNNYAETTYLTEYKKLKAIVSKWRHFMSVSTRRSTLDRMELGNTVNKPYFIDITVDHRPPNSTIVQQKVCAALSDVGVVTHYDKFRLFLSDGVSYNISAAARLKPMYPRLIHVTCVAHMLARVASETVDSSLMSSVCFRF